MTGARRLALGRPEGHRLACGSEAAGACRAQAGTATADCAGETERQIIDRHVGGFSLRGSRGESFGAGQSALASALDRYGVGASVTRLALEGGGGRGVARGQGIVTGPARQ
jgi:hypothetical protein